MKPICFIGARGGSKGVPRKNIRKLAGKPLIAYTIESALDSDLFSSVIVSTEDNKIASIAKKYGAEIPFIRPKKLASDTSGMYEVIIHAIEKLRYLGYEFDIMINRDCTVPFIRNIDIRGSIELLKRKRCDMVCGVYRQHHNPYFNMMEVNSNGFLKFSKKKSRRIKNRQDAPIVYQLNGLFTFYVEKLLKYKRFYMPHTLPYEILPPTGLMIDTEFEFQIAEMIAKNKIKI
ncbi:MAG TPA: acylneuraminate cytidylyltransferase family protein [Nitrosopumilaceae archaeon]|nr:acylneuraminate cytidylyltransferase family protein [Nitrosopumilaceae archaeon]